MIVYLRLEAGVNFSGFAGLPGQGIPHAFINNIANIENTLMLYMKFTDKSDLENVIEMECISLDKEIFSKKIIATTIFCNKAKISN
ncbi:MAG: hypothetical protein ABJR05_01455 [Balneola sp.]